MALHNDDPALSDSSEDSWILLNDVDHDIDIALSADEAMRPSDAELENAENSADESADEGNPISTALSTVDINNGMDDPDETGTPASIVPEEPQHIQHVDGCMNGSAVEQLSADNESNEYSTDNESVEFIAHVWRYEKFASFYRVDATIISIDNLF